MNGLKIGQDEVDIMRRTTIAVFEILEKAWATRDCALIDMKIEFGVDVDGKTTIESLIASVINLINHYRTGFSFLNRLIHLWISVGKPYFL